MTVVPTADAIQTDRRVEPYSGMTLVAVTGSWRSHDARGPAEVEVRYDGVARATTPVRHVSVAGPTPHADGPPHAFEFGTHLPLEAGVKRVQVVVRGGGREAVVIDRAIDEVGAPAAPAGGLPGLLGRVWHNLRSGEILSAYRWQARVGRAGEKLVHLKQKVHGRLLARRHRPRPPHDAYVAHTAMTPARRELLKATGRSFAYRPKVSVLLPVYEIDPVWLKQTVESVRAQVYENWELCVADDASADVALRHYLRQLQDVPNVKVTFRPKNGHISAATNSAAELATGEFVALLDHDDLLAPHALLEVVRLLQDDRAADVIYSDEDKIDAAGHRYDPQFKPDWSPELLLSYNYVNHFTVIRRSVFEQAGRFRVGYEGSQDHDLLFRVTELTDRVRHVPQVLYHWRSLPTSTASEAGVKPFVHTSGRQALHDHLARTGAEATTYVPPVARRLNLPINLLDAGDAGPQVAVVVAGPDAAAVRACVDAVHAKTTYRDYTVVVLHDPDAGPPPAGFARRGVRVLEVPGAGDPAAFARWANAAAAAVPHEFVLFLDPSLEVSEPRWLSRLVVYARRPGVGAAGPRVVASDGRVVHAGVVLNMADGTAPGHAFAGEPADAVSYYFYAEVARNVAALPRTCLLVNRRTFLDVGGFAAREFGSSLADVEFGLRLAEQGLRSVCVGGAELVSREPGAADGRADDALELAAFRRWHGRPADPYYNPNLSDAVSFRPANDCPLPEAVDPGRPLRVLVAAHNLNNPEGAPRYLSEIVCGLERRGSVHAAVFSPQGGRGEGVYKALGIPVTVGDPRFADRFVDGKWSPAEYDAFMADARKLFHERRPDMVLANTLCCFPVVEAAARAGVPSVWVIHESYSPAHLDRLFSPFARKRCELAFTLAGRVVPASHDTARLFAHLGHRHNVTVLHNGLPTQEIDAYLRSTSKAEAAAQIGAGDGRKVIVAVGTVCERKGQHTLVEAAARLAQRRDDFRVYLVGVRDHIPYANYVRHLIAAHRLGDFVVPVGETDRVNAYLRAADVYACTSHMEAFSRSILEAEAFGLPVVSTPCPGVGEQVRWGQNALRFEPGDADALADHLAALLADPARRDDMGRRSRAVFDTLLSYAEMLDRYDRVIRSVGRHNVRRGLWSKSAPVLPRKAA